MKQLIVLKKNWPAVAFIFVVVGLGFSLSSVIRRDSSAKSVMLVRDLRDLKTPLHISCLTNHFCLTCTICGATSVVAGTNFLSNGGYINGGQTLSELSFSQVCRRCNMSTSYRFKVWCPPALVQMIEPAATKATMQIPSDIIPPLGQ